MNSQRLNIQDYKILEQYDLSAQELHGCRAVCYVQDETVLHQGMPMDALYLVTDGTAVVQIQTESSKILTLCKCTAGDILGEVEFMTDCTAATTTVLAESCLRCVRIPIPENTAILRNCVPFLNRVGRTLAEKLLNRGNAQTIMALAPAEARLCSYILQTEKNSIFREPLTETAQVLGISYRHIFRLLHTLCQDGLLERMQSGYHILQPQMLKSRAEQTP